MKLKITAQDVVAFLLTLISIIILGSLDMKGNSAPAIPSTSMKARIYVRYSNFIFTQADTTRYVVGADTIEIYHEPGTIIIIDKAEDESEIKDFENKYHAYQ
jgi:hypothetical protein